ncbi:MAG: type I-C CRISPR-associated protein Cas8c/Csd1 [Tissierellia bacterium]|nr:type I-C CRISPR-associated protein Cas8c/Csd1 [Tissierellia bacterium]
MSWLSTLEETYNYLFDYGLRNPGEVQNLMPPGVITQNAHLEIVLNRDSEFLRAQFIPKEDAQTPIPSTDKSSVRTGGKAPHVIFDQLLYVAGDMVNYLKDGKEKETIEELRFEPYLKLLYNFKTEANNELLDILYKYIEKKTMVKDLIDAEILQLDDDGLVDTKVKYQSTDQTKFLVRFAIEKDGKLYKLWEDFSLFSDYSDYFMESFAKNDEDFCYATGKRGYMQKLHGKNIRFAGDGAKLISSNDSQNYTYRGRFSKPEEAVLISGMTSERAHSALRWLIRNQGFIKNGYAVIAWNTENEETADPMKDSFDLIYGGLVEEDDFEEIKLSEAFARNLKRALQGLTNRLDKNQKINIMAIDAATPGRMAILYYAEKFADDYIEAIKKWHTETAWLHSYRLRKIINEKGKEESKSVRYYGAPSPYDIVLCAFGVEQGDFMRLGDNDKFLNQQLRRLLPCIVDGAKLPVDFMRGAFRNAVDPHAKKYYNWQKCMSIACSLIRKYYIDRKGVDYKMALDTSITDRSYLYGRLLAIADKVEGDALWARKIDRQTTAMRSMEALSKRPYRTWFNIELNLNPYWKMISKKSASFYKMKLNEIMSMFELDEFENNRPLKPLFLLGYHCQMADLIKKKDQEENEDDK